MAIISVQNLSKAYTLYQSPRDVILEALFGGVRHDVFWALKDVSFDIEEGERVGFIGPNGAGKSTLLKIVTGNLAPTGGSVRVDGKVSAMLSLTSFLDPEATGLENIRLNLIMNGVNRREIPSLTEEIVDFTELGAFLHAPVRTYSSGMSARLSFAISTSVTPDILVVDEILGAGDAYFAAKATMRMIDLCNQGRALLFVSHAASAVQLLCTRAIWLDGGMIRETGPVEEITKRYEADFRRQEDEVLRAGNQARRRRLVNKVLPEELVRPDLTRVRLIGSGGRLADTHYVRKVELKLNGTSMTVPLEFTDIDDPGASAALDVIHSEWARPHNRRGSDSRVLAQGSSALRGGNILVKPPEGLAASVPLELAVESTSIGGVEELHGQGIDLARGEWIDLEVVERRNLGDGWTRSVFRGSIMPAEVNLLENEQLIEQIVDAARPDVEIVDVKLLVDGHEALSVRERQPFEVAVRVRGNRPVERVDAILNMNRADGMYIYWQSSGQAGVFAESFVGEKTFVFEFDPNLFGSGDYNLTVDIGNGFDADSNFPHTEIYDRRVNALSFTVARERPILGFGPVNYCFPVRVEEE